MKKIFTLMIAAAATWCTVSPASATGNGAVEVNVAENHAVPPEAPPTTLCAQCCWDGAAATWVDCYVTTNAYPFDNNTTNTEVVWSGNGNRYYEGARSDRNGRANTAAISSTGVSAVQLCKDLGAGWYLPAYEELINMSSGIDETPLNGLSGADLLAAPAPGYWSSSDVYENFGASRSHVPGSRHLAVRVSTDGSLLKYNKSTYCYVRCAWRD